MIILKLILKTGCEYIYRIYVDQDRPMSGLTEHDTEHCSFIKTVG